MTGNKFTVKSSAVKFCYIQVQCDICETFEIKVVNNNNQNNQAFGRKSLSRKIILSVASLNGTGWTQVQIN